MPTLAKQADLNKAEQQRADLAQSEKAAAATEPGSFKDEATEEKVVEIGTDRTKDPIKGIDPKDRSAPKS